MQCLRHDFKVHTDIYKPINQDGSHVLSHRSLSLIQVLSQDWLIHFAVMQQVRNESEVREREIEVADIIVTQTSLNGVIEL